MIHNFIKSYIQGLLEYIGICLLIGIVLLISQFIVDPKSTVDEVVNFYEDFMSGIHVPEEKSREDDAAR